jgi:WD40 repeat protein
MIARFVQRSETAAEARLRELRAARDRAKAAQERAEALRLAADAELALRTAHSPLAIALALSTESLLTMPTAQGGLALRHVLRIYPATRAGLDHNGPVYAVAFSPDGTRVATGSDDGSARLFEVEVSALIKRALSVMTRALNGAELRRYSLPPDCSHVNLWNKRSAHPAL